jgi:membrane associated rhomboid family serine protease
MANFPFIISFNLLLLCSCFLWNDDHGAWVQAVDNNGSFRKHDPPTSRFRILGSATNDGVKARNERHAHLSSTNRSFEINTPCAAPVSLPTAAPTAAPSPISDTQTDRDEHNAWLLQQQQYDVTQQYEIETSHYSSTQTSNKSRRRGKGILPSFLSTNSLASAVKIYAQRVRRESPTVYWTSLSSIAIFLAWNLVPAVRPVLVRFFLASRESAKGSLGLSLVLSAVSHNSFRHLLFNLLMFLNLTPALLSSAKVLTTSWASATNLEYLGPSKPKLWPFVVGGALSGNLLFLLFRPNGSCLGLSGVTCAMLGAYGAAVPDRVMKIRVYGVLPVSLKTGTLVQVLLGVSLAGSLLAPSSQICHLGHLGGLLFGLLYYQNVMMTGREQAYVPKLLLQR